MTYSGSIAGTRDVPGRPERTRGRLVWPQCINIVLGCWLLASTFTWTHAVASRVNTWVLGIAIIVVAALALIRPKLHRLNALAAAWLIVSTLVIHHLTSGTPWDNALVGLLVLGYSVATEEHGPGALSPRQGT